MIRLIPQQNEKSKQVKIEELNLKYEDVYQYEVTRDYPYLELEGEIEVGNALEALDLVKEIMEDKGLDPDTLNISIYEWLPETPEFEGEWNMITPKRMEKLRELEINRRKIRQRKKQIMNDLKQLEGKKIVKIDPSITKDGQLDSVWFTFEDNSDINIATDRLTNFLEYYSLPF